MDTTETEKKAELLKNKHIATRKAACRRVRGQISPAGLAKLQTAAQQVFASRVPEGVRQEETGVAPAPAPGKNKRNNSLRIQGDMSDGALRKLQKQSLAAFKK